MGTGPVVVGVDASPAARAAVLWAAAEAALTGAELVIVHVPQLPGEGAWQHFSEAAARAADDAGNSLLADCAELASACQPELVVRTALSHSDPAQALVDVSLGTRLVVLGSPPAPAGEVSILGSKRLRVSVHAHCPVLLVGPEAAFALPYQLSRVVVGADHTRSGHSALRLAAGFAVWHRIPLWMVEIEPSRDASAEAGPVDPTGQLRRDFPGLVLRSERRSGEASVVLPGYSDEHSLVVIGCRHSDDHWSTRIGPVATSVIHRGRGPVLVVGSAVATRAPYSPMQAAR